MTNPTTPAAPAPKPAEAPAAAPYKPKVGDQVMFHVKHGMGESRAFPAFVLGYAENYETEQALELGVLAHQYCFYGRVPRGHDQWRTMWWEPKK